MSDMPDFDSMSPEEMMRWMESLAKRQGATEGLTTSADMEVAQVSADDERLKDMGEYVPYGWSAEKWQEHLAKEEASKSTKQAAAPEPQPVVQPAASSTPDLDSMSPEEMMRWMESLAKRQGATEGLTTSADMEVAQVSADDERLKDMGEYVPYGWSAEKWQEHLAKEESAKAAKQSAAEDEEKRAAALRSNVLAAPSLDDLFSGKNLIADEEDELEYAAEEAAEYQYLDEEDEFQYEYDDEYIDYDEDSEPVAILNPAEWLAGLTDKISTIDIDEEAEPEAEAEEEEAPATQNSLDWLSSLTAQSPVSAAAPVEEQPAAAGSPLDWLSGLTGQEPEFDLNLDALSSLENLGAAESSGDPMNWLAGLAVDSSAALAGLGALAEAEEDAEEGSMEWMESLARRQGAETEELTTAGMLNIPLPASGEQDGPGYEPFSFETGAGTLHDDSEELVTLPSSDLDELELQDPGGWLDQLASGANVIDEDSSELEPLETFDEDYEEITENIMTRINTGRDVSPEEMQAFFEAQFRKAEQMPDEDELDEQVPSVPLEAQIPDWLRESMSSVPAADQHPARTETAEMMIENLGLDAEAEQEVDLPDWLSGGAELDSGEIAADIFANSLELTEESEPIVPVEQTVLGPLDTSDSWVQAFVQESSGEMEVWYKDSIAHLEGAPAEETVPPVAVASAVTLQHVDLPVETRLQAGEAQTLPSWMGGAAAASADSADQLSDSLDWLSIEEVSAEDTMPDWLREAVDDSAVPVENLPDWLVNEDLGMIASDEIPDWLRETLDEEEEVVDFSIFSAQPEPEPQPVQQIAAPTPPVSVPVPVRQSPAPVPVRAAAIDVAAALQSAQQHVSSGDIAGALADYEAVVRANTALDQVETAVRKLAEDKNQKVNPAVFRVLGDTLMRKGQLQEALDTYRKALNLL
jgi:hypothetical protein